MGDLRLEDTIAAIATPLGEGGIAVIRLSGKEALMIAEKVFRPVQRNKVADFASHTIHLGHIVDSQEKVLDQALASVFRAPHSYTGEDVVELSSHGGRVVSQKIVAALIEAGARHAEPGEFTKRAFLNGKLDLTQAEAVLDLIKARSDKALSVALRQLEGKLSERFKELKDSIMKLYAHMEAYLDFPDEQLEIYSNQETKGHFDKIAYDMKTLIASFSRANVLREGLSVVLVGKPNVGKSSLFNALLARDRALVSEFPGTTRDCLEEMLEINGQLICMTDTAGLWEQAQHPLDHLGMERTESVLKRADLYLYLIDGTGSWDEGDQSILKKLDPEKPLRLLINKVDLDLKVDLAQVQKLADKKAVIKISAKTGQGIDQLEAELGKWIQEQTASPEGEQITRLRHRNALEKSLEALNRAQKLFLEEEPLEMVTIELKQALDEMRELIGELYSEDLLDVIFSEFCIGK